jgi:hypothetical protein
VKRYRPKSLSLTLYHLEVEKTPDWCTDWRDALEFDIVEFGAGGIQLLRSNQVPRDQFGHAVRSDGASLVGANPGDWRLEWVVIGQETACGDPIFALDESPNPVFSAMHGTGYKDPKVMAPSLEAFTQCLIAFEGFAARRVSPPTPEEETQFLTVIRSLTHGEHDALSFWTVLIELDLDAFNWPV